VVSAKDIGSAIAGAALLAAGIGLNYQVHFIELIQVGVVNPLQFLLIGSGQIILGVAAWLLLLGRPRWPLFAAAFTLIVVGIALISPTFDGWYRPALLTAVLGAGYSLWLRRRSTRAV